MRHSRSDVFVLAPKLFSRPYNCLTICVTHKNSTCCAVPITNKPILQKVLELCSVLSISGFCHSLLVLTKRSVVSLLNVCFLVQRFVGRCLVRISEFIC